MKVLLDTTALSEPLHKHPNSHFMSHLERVQPEDMLTSSICVMELRYGAALKFGLIYHFVTVP